MNIQKFRIVMFQGRKLRRVPELPPLPGQPRSTVPKSCAMCVAMPLGGEHDKDLCNKLRDSEPPCNDSHGDGAGIYLPDEHAQDYIVELVRRRVSS